MELMASSRAFRIGGGFGFGCCIGGQATIFCRINSGACIVSHATVSMSEIIDNFTGLVCDCAAVINVCCFAIDSDSIAGHVVSITTIT